MVDNLVEVALLYGSGPWRGAGDLAVTIDELFGIVVPETDVTTALDRCVSAKHVYRGEMGRDLHLSPVHRELITKKIEEAEQLEVAVQSKWFDQIGHLIGDLTTETAWGCLIDFLRRLFNGSGIVALEYLDDSIRRRPDDGLTTLGESPDSALEDVRQSYGIAEDSKENLYHGIRTFFTEMDADRLRYCEQLLATTFDILAIGLDPEIKSALKEALPRLTVFLDTNVIYSVIGAQTNPLSAASREAIQVSRAESLPFKMYCHEATLAELERTISAVRASLTRTRWSQAVSRAICRNPQIVTSLEVMYHEINAETPTPPEVFLTRFSHLPILLEEYKIEIFRKALPDTQVEMESRAQLVAEFKEFVSSHARNGRRKRSYENLNHDISVWIESRRRAVRSGKGPLFSGSIMLSSDMMLIRFDRECLSKHNNGKRVVTRPDTLLQSLRPFLRTIPDYSEVFDRLFVLPEMRISNTNSATAVRRVAALLSTFEGISESTAERLLVNDMLMGKVSSLDEADDSELAKLIDSELVRELESLEDAQETLQEGMHQAQDRMREGAASIKQLSASMQGEQRKMLEMVAEKLENSASVVFLGGMNVSEANFAGRDFYQAKDSNVVAQGEGARAEGYVQQNEISLAIDLKELTTQLESLKASLIGQASSPDQYHSVAEVEAARAAAIAEDRKGVFSHLKAAGAWALDIAKTVGGAVAEEALKQALGIGQ